MTIAQLVTRRDGNTREVLAVPGGDVPVEDYFDADDEQAPLRPATQGLFELGSRLPHHGFPLSGVRLDDGDRNRTDALREVERQVSDALKAGRAEIATSIVRSWPSTNLAPVYLEFRYPQSGSILRLTRDGAIIAAGPDIALHDFVRAIAKMILDARRDETG